MDTLITNIQGYIDTFLVETIFTLLMTYGGFLMRWFFRTRESREALHSALNTGVTMVTDEIFDLIRTQNGQRSDGEIIESIVAYTKESVPDAISWLKPGDSVLRNMAKAYVNDAKVRLFGRD